MNELLDTLMSSYVNDICYTIDQQHIVSVSSDGTLRVWNIATSTCIRVIEPARLIQSYADISVCFEYKKE